MKAQFSMDRTEQQLIYDSAKRGSPAIEELHQVLQYQNLVTQLIRRDILTRYKRSFLGIAWTMLNPLGTMLILTIVFSFAFDMGPDFASYVLSGLLAWNFFSQTTSAAMSHLVWGGNLLQRIYIPPTAFALAAIGTGIVNLALAIVPMLVVMLITRTPIRLSILFLPVPMLLLAIFSLGIGLLLSTGAVYFPDITEMYQVILTAWIYLTPIIYPEEILPAILQQWLPRLNPIYPLVKLFRLPLFYGRLPTPGEFIPAAFISLLTLGIGWVIFTRKADEFAYRL
jgi:ABC-type polysaccharide/polyol phosphate export permease